MIKAISLALMVLTLNNVYAQESELSVSPKTCVALKKGQLCYQSLRILFSTSIAGDFCLTSSEKTDPLKCWSDSNIIEYRYRFASDKDIEFSMVDINGQPVAKARVSLVWVYKQSRKRNRWRLF